MTYSMELTIKTCEDLGNIFGGRIVCRLIRHPMKRKCADLRQRPEPSTVDSSIPQIPNSTFRDLWVVILIRLFI